MFFHDRADAGRQLAQALSFYDHKPDTLLLALPRGGVPVAYEVAQALHLPLDLMLVRKLGVPGHEELAMGAIANRNIQVLNNDIVQEFGISSSVIDEVAAKERTELLRRDKAYRHGSPPPELKGKTVILVDDGCATGANMHAAVLAATAQYAGRIVVAVPVASDSACKMLREETDEVVCLKIPEPFFGVGRFYRDFAQTTDEEVKTLLQQAGIAKAA